VNSFRRKPYLWLTLATCTALLVHGYHSAAEDGEIYVPGIKKLLNPSLYPFGAEFFLNHAHASLYSWLIATSVRISHLSFDTTLFAWYIASTFLTFLACWEWAAECFEETEARLGAVALLAALLTLPVAGTALYISDEYLTPRSLALFALLFATLNAWRGRYWAFAGWSVFAALVHPLMAMFGISLGMLLALTQRLDAKAVHKSPALAAAAVFTLFPLPSHAYQEALQTRSYFFVLHWHWYEWLGIIGPLALLWWFSQILQNKSPAVPVLSWSLIVYEAVYVFAAVIVDIPQRLDTYARFQPMRSLHLLYTFLIILGGGLLGKYLLRKHIWRWALLFVPLCFGMWFAQRQLFPTTAHIEWPGAAPTNDWLRGFDWIRHNTPQGATFAIDPNYMLDDDQHGFRAIAERSRLADAVKDAGAVTMFPQPPFAEDWLEQVTDEADWRHFQVSDLQRLQRKYGVNWVVLQRPAAGSLACPYHNATILVCHLDPVSSSRN
jgi:hypothetical protein